MAPTKVILLSCGSYNPPTNMHLRMFEIARDHLHKMGSHIVIGGVISPVHDGYGKKELTSATHRCAMLRLALHNNDWIRLSDWETKREGWTKTRVTIQHHQNLLNSWLFDTHDIKHHSEIEDMDWIPANVRKDANAEQNPIQVKLLCGADLLESFGTPGLWAEEDIDAIVGQHGLVVVTREGSNPNRFIYDSDVLTKYMHNIIIVTEWITNEISSTKIRRALRRGESAKYLLHDSVLDYIYKHGIYDAKRSSAILQENCVFFHAAKYHRTQKERQNLHAFCKTTS
ncbi:nicotinamide/nicotinic acid mononucleotide adenylyltransferase 3 isoform X3 [Neodiprion lecontei]|uniref:Nicotinamide-nucleotide adenylyltransferase n=2 Tax=Neodiprion TaxID=270857 RepID=A0ABM3FX50_NEOLC|nr:nicotinamide/nicotinic acid mononucleotide adenylyltransferase 3 isoform X3 [Neodiprion pinetum]XP_046592591.1 nicotinamide/nicotinic acid mononucleotide adenylyltransferase 3 isoform X3 [Neodiprion lecontei]